MVGPKGLIGGFFLLAGLVSFGAAAVKTYHVNTLAISGDKAQGTVTLMLRRSNGSGRGGGRSWFTYVLFQTESGQEITFRNRQGSALRSFNKGDIVEVVYDPAEPENAMINNLWTRFASVFGALFSSLFVGLGCWLIRRDRREQTELGWNDKRF